MSSSLQRIMRTSQIRGQTTNLRNIRAVSLNLSVNSYLKINPQYNSDEVLARGAGDSPSLEIFKKVLGQLPPLGGCS